MSSDPAARALALLTLLTNRPYWPGADLARRLGVTTRTLRRDVERLRGLGYVIDGVAGIDGGYRLRPGAVVPPLFLDGDEAVAVATALLTASAGATAGLGDAAARALAKLHHLLPPSLHGRIDAVRRSSRVAPIERPPHVDPGTLAALAEACRDGAAVRFGYRTRDDRAAVRRVEPTALVSVGRVWYLIAYDLDRADWRSFRVDRADAVERTGHGVARRQVPGGDPTAFLGASLAEMPYELQVEAHLGLGRDEALAQLPWINPRRVVGGDDGHCTVRLGARDLRSLAREVVDVIGVITPTSMVAPPAVLEHLARIAAVLGASR